MDEPKPGDRVIVTYGLDDWPATVLYLRQNGATGEPMVVAQMDSNGHTEEECHHPEAHETTEVHVLVADLRETARPTGWWLKPGANGEDLLSEEAARERKHRLASDDDLVRMSRHIADAFDVPDSVVGLNPDGSVQGG